MRMPWRRRSAGRFGPLLVAAGIKPGSVDESAELTVSREVAWRAARRDQLTTADILRVVEGMLRDEREYEFVVSVLEGIQNLVSHGLDAFRSPDEIHGLLGPRAAVCWDGLTGFWSAVAGWCALTGLQLESSAPLLTVENEELRMLLLTANRTLATGEKLGLAQAVRYEKAGGSPKPGYSHFALALERMGQG
ncbi:hypothetical protein ACIRQH_01655 [Streptomyces sp. NPDC102279]|uniref:hypothetical protein n=1 Tax=Streptomyces sp. NPDC102279 TaxID=3366153 RepID=UPI0037FB760B